MKNNNKNGVGKKNAKLYEWVVGKRIELRKR